MNKDSQTKKPITNDVEKQYENDERPKTLIDFVDTLIGGVVACVLALCACLIIVSYLVGVFNFIRNLH